MKDVRKIKKQDRGDLNLQSASPYIPMENQESITNTLLDEGFDKKSIYAFINHVGFYVRDFRGVSSTEETDTISRNQDMLKIFKAAIKYLEGLKSGSIRIEPDKPEYRTDNTSEDLINEISKLPLIQMHRRQMEVMSRATKIIPELEQILELIQQIEIKPAKGRPSIGGFIRAFAGFYAQHFGQPTQYRDGAFMVVLRELLALSGLPCADPSAAVRRELGR